MWLVPDGQSDLSAPCLPTISPAGLLLALLVVSSASKPPSRCLVYVAGAF